MTPEQNARTKGADQLFDNLPPKIEEALCKAFNRPHPKLTASVVAQIIHEDKVLKKCLDVSYKNPDDTTFVIQYTPPRISKSYTVDRFVRKVDRLNSPRRKA